MSTVAVGIDLGTTYSCVGVFRNGTVQILANDQGHRTTPSYVAFTDTDRLLGDAAKNQAASNPTNTIYDAKRLLGRKFSDPTIEQDRKLWPFTVVDGPDHTPLVEVQYQNQRQTFRPEEISAAVLLKMKQTAEAALGQPVRQAVITCPAYFNDSQRQATKDAATLAGLETLRIINEPTAAALAYGMDQKHQTERNVLIFDLGGGTFDVSILTLDSGVFEVKATGGDTHLGGEDFDNELVQFCVQDFKRRYKKDVTQSQRALKRLKTACEQAKRVLSSSTQTTLEVDSLYEGLDYSLTLTRAKFEDLCGRWFRSTLEAVERVLADAKLSKSQIDEVVLVGGSTRIPKVQELLSGFFGGKELCKSVNPDEAVAYGAAIQAAILSGSKDQSLQDLVLLDVCPLSLGIETRGQLMTVLIPRNTSIPCQKTQFFSTFADRQTQVRIQVYEGERQFTRDNHLLGTFDLTDIPPLPRGQPRLEITYQLDTNGILTVTAQETSTQNQKSLRITNDRGRMSKEDIEQKIREAERFQKEDEARRERWEARQTLEGYVYDLRHRLTDPATQEQLAPHRAALESLVQEGLDWLAAHENETREVYAAQQTRLQQKVEALRTSSATPPSPNPPVPNPTASAGPQVEELN